MSDLNALLSDAARLDVPATTPEQVEADLARGRRSLARRRARRIGAGGAIAAVLVLGGFAAAQIQAAPAAPAIAEGSGTAVGSPSIRLVAYTGEQPAGYTVDKVPSGWELQGANEYALVIAKPDDADKDLNSWNGKLVVMLASNDQVIPDDGTKVTVGGSQGVISRVDSQSTQLYYTDDAGHAVVIQAPPTLHWSNAQLVDFAAAVHVNANAVAGNG